MYVNKDCADLVTTPIVLRNSHMLKKIAAAAVLAGALAFSAAAPAVLSAGSIADNAGTAVAIGNWPDPMRVKDVNKTNIGNWPDPMVSETTIGNWPDPM
jgi:hypothetical protein